MPGKHRAVSTRREDRSGKCVVAALWVGQGRSRCAVTGFCSGRRVFVRESGDDESSLGENTKARCLGQRASKRERQPRSSTAQKPRPPKPRPPPKPPRPPTPGKPPKPP